MGVIQQRGVSILPAKEERKRFLAEISRSAERAVQEGKIRRSKIEGEEGQIERLRAQAGALDLNVPEVPARVAERPGSMFTRGLSASERRGRERAGLEDILGKAKRAEDVEFRRGVAEETFDIQEKQEKVKREAKELKQLQKDEEFVGRFFKDSIGQTFNAGTDKQYTLDTPQEGMRVYEQTYGRKPSKTLSDAIFAMQWPVGGVDELAGAEGDVARIRQLEDQAVRLGVDVPKLYDYRRTETRQEKVQVLQQAIADKRAESEKEEGAIGAGFDPQATIFVLNNIDNEKELDEFWKARSGAKYRKIDAQWIWDNWKAKK